MQRAFLHRINQRRQQPNQLHSSGLWKRRIFQIFVNELKVQFSQFLIILHLKPMWILLFVPHEVVQQTDHNLSG